MKSQKNIKSMVLLGLMAAVLVILAYTPLGYLNIGPLAITFNTIPVGNCSNCSWPSRRHRCRRCFWIDQLLTMLWRQRTGNDTVWNQSDPDRFSMLCAKNAGRSAHWTSLQCHAEALHKCYRKLCGNRIFCCFPEHALLHEQLDSVVWKNGHHSVLSGNTCPRKKCLSVRLCLCRHKCHCRMGFFHFSYGCSRGSFDKGKINSCSKSKIGCSRIKAEMRNMRNDSCD